MHDSVETLRFVLAAILIVTMQTAIYLTVASGLAGGVYFLWRRLQRRSGSH